MPKRIPFAPQFYFMSSREPPRLILLLIVLLLITGAVNIGLALYLSTEKSYTVYDSNVPITVSGRFNTVTDVIDAAAISLRPEDLVIPELTETADPEKPITITRAKPVVINSENGSQKCCFFPVLCPKPFPGFRPKSVRFYFFVYICPGRIYPSVQSLLTVFYRRKS